MSQIFAITFDITRSFFEKVKKRSFQIQYLKYNLAIQVSCKAFADYKFSVDETSSGIILQVTRTGGSKCMNHAEAVFRKGVPRATVIS
jgi:hypothetical protein